MGNDMEPVKRKPNRLTGWDYSQNGVYFITICTKDGASILGKVVRDGVPYESNHSGFRLHIKAVYQPVFWPSALAPFLSRPYRTQ